MHEKDKGEWDLLWRFLVENTAVIAGSFGYDGGEEFQHPPKGINTKGAAEGAIEFLLKSFDLGDKVEISKVLDKIRYNNAFP